MCSVTGAWALDDGAGPLGIRHFPDVMNAARERGRDSAGWMVDDVVARHTSDPWLGELAADAYRVMRQALANNRAEPTTEWVQDKAPEDVQPYHHRGWWVVHNGTIANDRELAHQLGIPAPRIDSMVLPHLLAACNPGGTLSGFTAALASVTGSFALLAYHEPTDAFFYAVNYKPLFVERVGGGYLFASLPHHLPGYGQLGHEPTKVPPYTAGRIARDGTVEQRDLLPAPTATTPAIVVCSGGLDSTVVATVMAQTRPTTLLHFTYGARAQEREGVAVAAIARELGCELLVVDATPLFTEVIGASRLTSTKPTELADGEAGAELAWEWVPARNLIMLSMATGIAEARGAEVVALGNNLEESGAYPDNEQEFIRTLNRALPNAVNLGKRVQLAEPVGNLMKHEIVRLGLEVGAPLGLAWSCYDGGELHCGSCGPCYMRRRAFEMNGEADPVVYAG